MRLVLFSNAGLRPDSTCLYFVRAFERVLGTGNVWHVQTQEELQSLKGTEADLFLKVDDGQSWQEWNDKLHPSAYYVIDTHLDPWREDYENRYNFDSLFFAQKNALVQRWRCPDRTWLPLGCDPEYHDVGKKPKRYDVCFLGNFHSSYGTERLDYVDHLFKNVDVPFYSNYRILQAYTEKMAESKLVLNRSLNKDVNMRFFEAMCSGSALLTDRIPDQDVLGFKEGVHYIGYDSKEEMVDKAKWYLEHEWNREQIAIEGQILARQQHTYTDRVLEMLKVLKQEKVNV